MFDVDRSVSQKIAPDFVKKAYRASVRHDSHRRAVGGRTDCVTQTIRPCKHFFDWGVDEINLMLRNRTTVGEQRYEGGKWHFREPEQEAVIGPDWRYSFGFLNSKPETFLKGYRKKWNAYHRSGNLEFLVDAINYASFLHILGDVPAGIDPFYLVMHTITELRWPLHPKPFFECADQDIHGQEYSGSMTNDAAVKKSMRGM